MLLLLTCPLEQSAGHKGVQSMRDHPWPSLLAVQALCLSVPSITLLMVQACYRAASMAALLPSTARSAVQSSACFP